VPGLKADNLFSKTYGTLTAQAIAKEHIVPKEEEVKDRYLTTT